MLLKLALVIFIIVLIFVCNFFVFAFKLALRQNGYSGEMWGDILQDLPDFIELINNESDPKKQQEYKRLLWYLMLSLLLFVTTAILLMAILKT